MRLVLKSLILSALTIAMVSCQREPIAVEANVTPLSDYQSNDGMVSLNITGGKTPYTVVWSNDSVGTEISQLSVGEYIATITDALGNSITDTVFITGPQCPVCIDRDARNYQTAIFGEQTWMVEDLQITTDKEGYAIESFTAADSLGGGTVYSWIAAMDSSTESMAQGICPDGWHIPSVDEWKVLLDTVAPKGTPLSTVITTLSVGFVGFYNGDFQNTGNSVSFWTSTKSHNNAMKIYINKNLEKPIIYHENVNTAISVRCVKDK